MAAVCILDFNTYSLLLNVLVSLHVIEPCVVDAGFCGC